MSGEINPQRKSKHEDLIGAGIGFVITAISSLPYFYMGVDLGRAGNVIGAVIAAFYLPGLFLSMALSGNIHGGSLQIAFLLNFISYGLLSYGLLRWRFSRAK